ncbi:MAG: DUF3597 domain-containing protein [Nevskiaceae bacterium]|nr:MAG: DUF3597 domain-containing protein [Nevskiaceae bacterium]
MSLFSSILDKLGFGKRAEAAAPAAPAPAAPAAPTSPAVAPMALVDVVSKLESMAAASAQKLNWKTSIVDLLKLLGLDSSLSARKDLAKDVGMAGDFSGTAEQNIALHKAVLKKLADNGGNIPKDLLN